MTFGAVLGGLSAAQSMAAQEAMMAEQRMMNVQNMKNQLEMSRMNAETEMAAALGKMTVSGGKAIKEAAPS